MGSKTSSHRLKRLVKQSLRRNSHSRTWAKRTILLKTLANKITTKKRSKLLN